MQTDTETLADFFPSIDSELPETVCLTDEDGEAYFSAQLQRGSVMSWEWLLR